MHNINKISTLYLGTTNEGRFELEQEPKIFFYLVSLSRLFLFRGISVLKHFCSTNNFVELPILTNLNEKYMPTGQFDS